MKVVSVIKFSAERIKIAISPHRQELASGQRGVVTRLGGLYCIV